MTSLRTKIIAGVLGIALITTVGAIAIMHNRNKAAKPEDVKAEVTTTTTATATTTYEDDFIPVKTEPMPEVVSRTYEVNIKGDDTTITQISVNNYGNMTITYRRGGVANEEKWGIAPTSFHIVDESGDEGKPNMDGYPQIGFGNINPLSKSFTLKIAFEDLEEQTIEIVLPEEYTQK